MSSAEIGGIVIGAISAIGVIWWIIKYILDRREKWTEKENEKLKLHLEELKSQVCDPLSYVGSRIVTSHGEVVLRASTHGVPDLPFPDTSDPFDFEVGEQFDSFNKHFAEIAAMWKELRQDIDAHNKEYDLFHQEIMQALAGRTGICGDIFLSLSHRWQEVALDRAPLPDFRQIESTQHEGGYTLRAPSWARALALVKDETDIERCKYALVQVSESKEYQEKAAKIYIAATNLAERLRQFADMIGQTIDEISRYWPDKRFKRLTSCPICQRII